MPYQTRLNQVSVYATREGVYYGGGEEWECSEIYGILHSSMPIVVESISTEKFLQWLYAQL